MDIILPQEQQDWLDAEVAASRFSSVDEALAVAVASYMARSSSEANSALDDFRREIRISIANPGSWRTASPLSSRPSAVVSQGSSDTDASDYGAYSCPDLHVEETEVAEVSCAESEIPEINCGEDESPQQVESPGEDKPEDEECSPQLEQIAERHQEQEDQRCAEHNLDQGRQ